MVALSEGDLAGARRAIAGATEVDPRDLAAYIANFYDLGWVLDDAGQRLVLTLGPERVRRRQGGLRHRAGATLRLARRRGLEPCLGRLGRAAFALQLRDAPNDPQRHVFRGLALAYAGRRNEAVAEGERAVALAPISKDVENGAYILHQLVRIYVHAGQPEKALDGLEKLMSVPYYLSPAWLRIDPEFAPLKGNPRFERLAKGRREGGRADGQSDRRKTARGGMRTVASSGSGRGGRGRSGRGGPAGAGMPWDRQRARRGRRARVPLQRHAGILPSDARTAR